VTVLTVALLQLRSPGPDPGRALEVGERACRETAALGADLALFPECWQAGYAWTADGRTSAAALAIDPDDPFLQRFRDLARELDMAIVVTYLQRWPGAPRNAATLVDRHGRAALTYAKVHTCDFGKEADLTPGDRLPTADLETAGGSVRIGLMICFDREFPEAARALMLGGAELLLTPNASPLPDDRVGQFRARAFENMVGVAMANYAAEPDADPDDHDAYDGRSVAFSGIAFDAAGRPLDHTLVEAGRDEQIALARFDLDALREHRAREVWGDAYRRPGAYAALSADGPPRDVFRRVDARRAVERASSTCEACGAAFGCGAGTGACWCVEVEVPAERLGELNRRFERCLCPACLGLVVAGELPRTVRRGRSAAPPAASTPSAD
jgi:N-carbamoylputrescine amidase